ncbi:hypothetical protein EV207_1526 [Scopulibacillus darangshiensis]|uniref:Probable membrane transporter protein n=1 Tax=Scopulibacillus darangshiensis TaxID=442528 RepID=A0A4R2NG50_9BACL|nr:sulfite exporter TauE/SafE family protein [Scopulibacillus darangshiensis]TCP20333.1 hypothetical protein EV207_1526 [Scopulibacillus darangshiensis]
MKHLIMFLLIGFAAQLIDGALGMAYGSTSTSLLLTYGVAPAMASASVHLAEIVTTGVSGLSHIKLGNVDRHLILKLSVPGVVGAFFGACFLSWLPGHIVKPYISIFLLCLGVYIVFRFLFQKKEKKKRQIKALSKGQMTILGLFAGFADSTGGGGWGPVATPVLLTKGIPARKVIGSVDTSECAVALASTIGFFLAMGWEQIHWGWVFTLMIGGILAAPLAAWLVKVLPSSFLGVSVGGLIILTNIRLLFQTWPIPRNWILMIYSLIVIGWGIAIFMTSLKVKKGPFMTL